MRLNTTTRSDHPAGTAGAWLLRSMVVALASPIALAQFQVARLIAHDGQTGDKFGHAVALDGDTAIVGAIGVDGVGDRTGAAYIFRRVNGAWIEEAKLVPSAPLPQGVFGTSVAIQGDRVVVGAPDTGGPGSSGGSAYVFRRTGAFPLAIWTQQSRLTASNDASGRSFGRSVAISPGTIAVGAPSNGGMSPYPTVYTFAQTSGIWTETQRIEDQTPGVAFGWSVDLDADTLLVGSLSSAPPYGSVHVFLRASGTWQPQATLTVPSTSWSLFGNAVAIDGDLAVVAAPWNVHAPSGPSGAGAVFAFRRTGSAWSTPQIIEASAPAVNENMGTGVAVEGNRITISTPAYSGAVDIADDLGAGWILRGRLIPSSTTQNSQFGASVSISGDFVLAGCPDGHGLNGSSGSALVFSLIPPAVETYCTGKLNSAGCIPFISATGTASASEPSPFAIDASLILNNKYGLMFFGVSGRTLFPFQGGTLCVLPALQRTPVQNSGGSASGADCTGTYSIDFNALVQSSVFPNLAAGVLVNAQYWYRDPQSASTTGLTDAIEFGIGF